MKRTNEKNQGKEGKSENTRDLNSFRLVFVGGSGLKTMVKERTYL